MTHKARLAQLEKRTQAQHGPQVIEIYGTREDGTTYLIDSWKRLMDADARGDLDNCPQWQEFTSDEQTTHTIKPA